MPKRKQYFEDSEGIASTKMLKLNQSGISDMDLDIADVTSVEEGRKFKFQLTDKKAKSNLIKSAGRSHFLVETKQMSKNLKFSAGAYLQVAKQLIKECEHKFRSQTSFTQNNLNIKVQDYRDCLELNDKHFDTKIVFLVNEQKVVMHCYNSTQNLMVNGSIYEELIEEFLEPLFRFNIERMKVSINEYDKAIVASLGAKGRPLRARSVKSVRSVIQTPQFVCKKCDFKYNNYTELKKHKVSEHSNILNFSDNSVLSIKHSTRNNSISEDINTGNVPNTDTISLLDESKDDTKQVTIEELCPVPTFQKPNVSKDNIPKEKEMEVMDTDNMICSKCVFEGKDIQTLKEHTEMNHRISEKDLENLGGMILTEFFCTLCSYVTDNNESLKKHIDIKHESNVKEVLIQGPVDINEAVKSPSISPEYSCGKCDFSVCNKVDLDSHVDENHKVGLEEVRKCGDVPSSVSPVVNQSSSNEVTTDNPDVNFQSDVNVQSDVPVPVSPSFACRKCTAVCANPEEFEAHLKDKHLIMNVYNCKSCQYRSTTLNEFKIHVAKSHPPVPLKYQCCECDCVFLTEVENEWHMETSHDVEQRKGLSCSKCDFKSFDVNELNSHIQSKHMSMKVNIDVKEQTILTCDQCEYKCRLNIQLKKHRMLKHEDESKYSCKECGYTTDYVANTWVHTHEEHPDKSFELKSKEAKDLILRLVAEQNADIAEEMGGLREGIKSAFENLINVVETNLASIKDDSNDKCKTLAETVIKLYEKISALETKKRRVKVPKHDSKQGETTDKEEPINPKTKSKTMQSELPSSSIPKNASSTPSAPPASYNESAPKPNQNRKKSSFMSKPKVLYVADSVGHSASIRQIEGSQKCRITTARAYSSVYDPKARWPTSNFTDVTRQALNNPGREQFDVLVVSAPTVDITNLDTTQLGPRDNTEAFQHQTILSCQNMIHLAENSLRNNPSLAKVVIMEHPPRFDMPGLDPTSLKPELAKLANSTLGQLWLNSPLKDKICIGRHNLVGSEVGTAAHLSRYQNSHTGRYDGIHFYSQIGSKVFTNSLVNIFMGALSQLRPSKTANGLGTAQSNVHTGREQTRQQGQYKASVPTRNRFDVLNQGNF